MRVDQLRLERFGILRDHTVDLSGGSFHVIAGPNGTGKSTIRAAFSDLLFGFANVSPWAIGFEPSQLKVGAIIRNTAGRAIDFDRLKGRRNTLVTPGGLPLEETVLQGFLTGIDRRTFEALYALDAERLRRGGDDMLRAQSDVGQTLYAAASGIAALSDIREELRNQLDEIGTLRRATEKPLWKAEQAYQSAIQQTQSTALRVDEWNVVAQKLADAKEHVLELNRVRRELEGDRIKLERQVRVSPIIGEIDHLGDQLRALSDAKILPADFGGRWRTAIEKRNRIGEITTHAAAACERRVSEKAALPTSSGKLLAVSAAIEALNKQAGNIESLKEAEIKRERDVRLSADRLAGHATALGSSQDSAERLANSLPSAKVIALVRALLNEHEGLQATRSSAIKATTEARDALEQDKEDLAELGKVEDPFTGTTALHAARSVLAQHLKAIADARRAMRAREHEETIRARLGLWSDTTETLASTSFPDAEIVRNFKLLFEERARLSLDARGKISDLEAEKQEINHRIEDMSAGGAVPTLDAVKSARGKRDDAWRQIREDAGNGVSSNSETIDTYEELMLAADNLVDRRVSGVQLLSQQKLLEVKRVRTDEALVRTRKAQEELDDKHREDQAAWKKLWNGTNIAGDVAEPDVMLAWLERKEKVLEAMTARQAAEVERDEATSLFDRAWKQLQNAGAAFGVVVTEKDDVEVAEQRVTSAAAKATDRWTRHGELDRAIQRRSKEFQKAEAVVDEAGRNLANWQLRWEKEMPTLGLPVSVTLGEVTATLEVWANFAQEVARRTESQRLLKGVREDLQRHQTAVESVLANIGTAAAAALNPPQDWSAWPNILYQRLQNERAAEQKETVAEKNLFEAREALATATEDERLVKDACKLLMAEIQVTNEIDVVTAIEHSDQKRQLNGTLKSKLEYLFEASDGIAEKVLRAELDGVEREQIRETVALNADARVGVESEIESAVRSEEQCQHALRALELREGFNEAAHAARNQAALVSELTQRWMRIVAATTLLDNTIESYRQANEGPLIKRANEIFISIAGNQLPDEFQRLDVDYEKPNDPRLIALRASGTSCRVEAMSEGTRDQLWLALRIAALEIRSRDAEPMPFLADDLFSSSDAPRAESGIRYLSELAKHTQVILFTHHDYVVDAARRVVSNTRVHELRR